MIGMNQIKKRLINGILIGLAIGLVFVILTIIISHNIVKGYKEGTNKDFLQNYTSEVVVFTRDVVQGETITEDMLNTARIHNNTVPSGAILSKGTIIGKVAKYNIVRNATAVSSMVSDKIVSEDVRIQEINEVILPTDLAVNDFIDIRLMDPSGIEYIVLAQKQVTKIVGTTIWMNMSEEDTLLLNSAIVDSYLNDGTKLYAVNYADPTTQIKIGDEKAMELAKTYIKEKLGNELSGIKSIDEVYTTETDTNKEVNVYAEKTAVAPVVTATDKILDLVTKYAIEYRYYIESYNKIEANYQPNSQVMSYMRNNKYIVEQAKEKLSETARQNMERSIAMFENTSGDNYSNVVAGINNSITVQQGLRNQALGQ